MGVRVGGGVTVLSPRKERSAWKDAAPALWRALPAAPSAPVQALSCQTPGPQISEVSSISRVCSE